MMGGDFGLHAAGRLMLPLLVGVFVAGGALAVAVFYGIPWLWNHVSIVIR